MSIRLEQKLINIQNICNEILQNLANNNIDIAKQKSWLLHEIVCTKFSENYGKEKEK